MRTAKVRRDAFRKCTQKIIPNVLELYARFRAALFVHNAGGYTPNDIGGANSAFRGHSGHGGRGFVYA